MDGQLTGFLLLRAQRAAGAFDGTHSCGFLSQGGDPPPSMAAWPAREAIGRAGQPLIAREVCLVCVWGKSNLPLELRRKAVDCSRVTAGPIDLI